MRRAQSQMTPCQSDVAESLDEALAAMSEKERQVLLLRFLQRRNIQETAEALEVSAEAVEKRQERGLEKLRQYFVRQGFAMPAPALAGTLTAEGTKAAPPALAGAIIATSAASAGATALAKATAITMAWHSAKFAAIAACAAVAVGLAAAGLTSALHPAAIAAGGTPASARGTAVGATPVGLGLQYSMMVRWDFIMTEEGAARIRSLAEKTATDSIGYDTYLVDGDALRTAVAAPAADLVVPPTSLMWPFLNSGGANGMEDLAITSTTGINQFAPDENGQQTLLQTGMIQHAVLDRRPGAIRLRIDDATHKLSMSTVLSRDVQVKFVGEVPTGRAAVFVGAMGHLAGRDLVHVSVWEAFSSSDEEWPFFRTISPDRWIGQRFGGLKKLVDRAVAWNDAGQPYDQVAPPWEKKTEGGTVVRLVGVSDPARWPSCWWGGDKKAVKLVPTMRMPLADSPDQRVLAIEVFDPFGEPEPAWPHASVDGAPGESAQRTVAYVAQSVSSPVLVNVGSGAWQLGPKIAKGETASVAGVDVAVSDLLPGLPKRDGIPGNTWIYLRFVPSSAIEISATAYDKSGKRVDSVSPPEAIVGDKFTGMGPTVDTQNVPLALEDIDHVILRWRKRQTVAFDSLPADPLASPDSLALPSRPMMAAATAGPSSLAPAPDSPEAFLPRLLAAARTHDTTKVRALMQGQGPDAGAVADMLAEMLTDGQLLLDTATQKFGPADAGEAFGSVLESQTRPTWKVMGDRAVIVSNDRTVMNSALTSGLVRVGHEWRLQIVLPPGLSAEQTASMRLGYQEARRQLEVSKAIAADIAAGKFNDAFEARDELTKRKNELIKSPQIP